MESLETFAKGGHVSSTVLKDTALAKKIIEYYEPARIMRQFAYDYPIDRLSTVLPKDPGSTEMAVEIAEMADIPIYRTEMESVPVKVNKIATRFFMSVEAEIEDFNGTLYTREAKGAGERMARKEDYDISTVLQAGALSGQAAVVTGELHSYDASLAKAALRALEFEATDILINPEQWPDIEAEATLYFGESGGHTQPIYTSEAAKYQGKNPQGATWMGLRVTESPKITAGTALVLARAVDPLWFVYNGSTVTKPYEDGVKGRGAEIYAFWKPVVMRGTAIYKITGC
jgi:hypothetical protein